MKVPWKMLQCFLVCALFATPASHAAAQSAATPSPQAPAGQRDGQHDFDWEFGSWNVHVKRLQHPLTGSTAWVDLDGTVNVRKVWDGRGNLAEVDIHGQSGRIEFLAMRLYNAESHQWSISFSTVGTGSFSVPMFGEFKYGVGEFYDQEPYNGRMILVRFLFLAISPDSGRSEQAFSDDGGKTWETNWINTYTRIRDKNQP